MTPDYMITQELLGMDNPFMFFFLSGVWYISLQKPV